MFVLTLREKNCHCQPQVSQKFPDSFFPSERTAILVIPIPKSSFVVCRKKLKCFAGRIIENFASKIKLFPFPCLKMHFLKTFNESDFSRWFLGKKSQKPSSSYENAETKISQEIYICFERNLIKKIYLETTATLTN